MGPRIGIAQCLDDRGRWKAGHRVQYLDTAYAEAVANAGGTPLHLPLQEHAEALLDGIDGLLIPGGPDFAPERPYPDSVEFEPAPPAQLGFDRRLLEAALERGLPFLGICYGMQLLALLLGGRLHYDIPSDLPDAAAHQLGEKGRHGLRLDASARLARVLGDAGDEVNSRHHQAVAAAGPELRVVAWSPDGVVEAVERAGDPFCLGVQWHPETLEGARRDRLFAAFVAAARV
jgi:putative glutamine amidotransferase